MTDDNSFEAIIILLSYLRLGTVQTKLRDDRIRQLNLQVQMRKV